MYAAAILNPFKNEWIMNVFSNTDTDDNIAFIFRNSSAKLMLLDVNPAEPKWIEYKWSCLSDVIQIRQLNILPLNSPFNKYKYIIKKLKLRQTRTVELFLQRCPTRPNTNGLSSIAGSERQL